MKTIIIITICILCLSACKKPTIPDCSRTNCPLSDGTLCPGNTVNVYDECIYEIGYDNEIETLLVNDTT